MAESLGKEGEGILPNIETDSLTLSEDTKDRTAIIYETKTDLFDERLNYYQSLEFLNPDIPRITFKVENVIDLAPGISLCGNTPLPWWAISWRSAVRSARRTGGKD